MPKYLVKVFRSKEIEATDEDNAIDIFWEELGHDSVATVEEIKPVSHNSPRSCNRHFDCDKAEQDLLKRNPGKELWQLVTNFHCHNEECEECFGN